MTSYNKPNPSHGQKVTSDPQSKSERKHEYAGPIASDSLAGESLRANKPGHFAEGNPADISSVKGSQGTFAAQDNPGGPHHHEVKPGHKLHDDQTDIGRKSGSGDHTKTQSARTGTSGGGTQRHEGYEGVNRAGRDTSHPETVDDPPRKRGDIAQQRRSEGGGGGYSGGEGIAGDSSTGSDQDLNATKYAPSTNNPQGTVGSEEVKKKETPDWSKIPKDTQTTTNIGSEEDPGRAAELHFQKANTKQQGGGYARSKGVAGEGGVVKDEGQYQTLNPDEQI